MNSIFLALEQLRTQLSQALPATPGIRHFDVSFPLNDAFDPLAWLGAQQCYPQFYWQQRSGDEEGCRFDNGQVFTPTGFKEAYKQFVEGGWPSLAHDVEHGGQGLLLGLTRGLGARQFQLQSVPALLLLGLLLGQGVQLLCLGLQLLL